MIVIPSEKSDKTEIFYHMAQQISASWYIYGRGMTQILRDDEVFDGDAARYNMIVLGGPKENKWTARREHEGNAVMGEIILLVDDYSYFVVSFLADGGFQIGDRKYTEKGTGTCSLKRSSRLIPSCRHSISSTESDKNAT